LDQVFESINTLGIAFQPPYDANALKVMHMRDSVSVQ